MKPTHKLMAPEIELWVIVVDHEHLRRPLVHLLSTTQDIFDKRGIL